MNQKIATLKQYDPWERVLMVALWAYENAIGRKARQLFELKYLLDDLSRQKCEVERVGHSNVVSITDDPQLVSYNVSLRRGSSDIPVYRHIFWGKSYKMLIDRILKDRCEQDIKFIVDAGANIGCSMLYFKKLFGAAKVVAIE